MHRRISLLLAVFMLTPNASPATGQESSDQVAQALARGDAFYKQREYDKARDAYRKADKLSHHSCAQCFLGMFRVDRQFGDLFSALDDAKRAVKAAGDDKPTAAKAHMARGVLLAQMSGKPTDKKLREAEDEIREVLSLDASDAAAHFNLGEILMRQERDDEGILELKKYIAAPNADPPTVREAQLIMANPIRAREPFAPDFSFATLEGETISNAALRGKVVLLDFWGSWCGPCRESVPILVDIRKRYLNRPFQMVGISSDSEERAWKSFIAANHMDWSEYLDRSGAVQGLFKVDSFPTFIVLDRDGVIRFRQSGVSEMSASELDDAINKALKRPSQPAAASAAAAAKESSVSTSEPSPPAAPASVRSASLADLADIERGTVSGHTYENGLLSFSYEFPEDWIPAKLETLHAANAGAATSAVAGALKQHPELGNATQVLVPKTVFYASRSGVGDGQHVVIPCVRITVLPRNGPKLTVDSTRRNAEAMKSSGMNLVGEPEEYAAGDRDFFRTDYELTRGDSHAWLSRFEGVVNGYLLTLEFVAANKQELEQLVSTADSLSFH